MLNQICAEAILYNRLAYVAVSDWKSFDATDGIWKVLREYGCVLSDAYMSTYCSSTIIVGLQPNGQASCYFVNHRPFSVMLGFYTVAAELHRAVSEYIVTGCYRYPTQNFDDIGLCKLVESGIKREKLQKHNTIRGSLLPVLKPSAFMYELPIQPETTIFVGVDDADNTLWVVMYNPEAKFYVNIESPSTSGFIADKVCAAYKKNLRSDEATYSMIKDFLSAYAPKAVYDLEQLRFNNPNLSLEELAKLARQAAEARKDG